MTAKLDLFAAAPALMKTWMSASLAIVESLEPGLVEFVEIRASQINGCANCLNMHVWARQKGESEQRIYLLSAWGRGARISGADALTPMLGHMQDLQRIYDTVSDRALFDLCRRFPGFHRYADLMEAMSENNQEMIATGTHPYADLPELPEPLKTSLISLMRGAVELEREFQAAVDAGRADQAGRLTAMKRQWAGDLQNLVREFRSSNVPLRTHALVQQVVKAMAERIERMGRE